MSVYEMLLEHMNRQPFVLPHPTLRSGIEILQELYSEEEASLLLQMAAFPYTAENIAQRAGREPDAVARMLDDMARRGLVFAGGDDSLRLYGLFPFLRGFTNSSSRRSWNDRRRRRRASWHACSRNIIMRDLAKRRRDCMPNRTRARARRA